MKKITALLLCFLLLCTLNVTAFADQPGEQVSSATIYVTVPDSHKITVVADAAQVFYQGVSDEEFSVGRLSQPRLLIRPDSGKVIQSVTLNGQDVTQLLHGGYLELPPVYEDKLLTVTTEAEPAALVESYTVRGKVTLNGQPLAGVELELRSTLKTGKTDQNGNFAFTNVEPGQHSLTALTDGKVMGYLSFMLQKGNKADLALLSDGTYTVFVDYSGVGVELQLTLNEEQGTLAPTEAGTIQKPVTPQTGDYVQFWWFLLWISTACIVVLETYRRKKKSI